MLRFPLEGFEAVRASVPTSKVLGVRVSATDWVEGGWDLAQTLEFARRLKQGGVDYITASSGGLCTALHGCAHRAVFPA